MASAPTTRLISLIAASGKRSVGDGRSSSGRSRSSGGGAAPAGAGIAPLAIDADRGASPTLVRIDADDLYTVFDPVGLNKQWTVTEVLRVKQSMPNMRLSFTVTDPAPTVVALDRAVFEGGYSDSTSDLVSADVANGNRGFALYGDVTNAFDYHLWALALVLGTEYKARPMHTSASFDVSAFYYLRKVGQIRLPPAAASEATKARYAEVRLLGRDAVKQICSAFGVAPPEAAGNGSLALARLESSLAEETDAAAAFWSALDIADKNASIPIACMAVVRAGMQPSSGAPPPSPAGPPPPAPISADDIFRCFYDGFVGPPLGSAKALSLQVLFPKDACLYRNEAVAGAGAYDDVIKTWIGDNEAALANKLPPTPFTDPGPLLRLLVATMASSTGATSGSSAAAGATAPSGGGGGGSGGGRDGLLAEALDTTKLPSAKGEDGHEKVVPLPAGFLSMVQAEAIVPKRHLLDAALGLGQSAAGADACANLGVIQNVVDSVTGVVTRVRQSDEALGWAMTQDIATATSSGGSERAKTARSLHSAQGVVINHVTAMIKKASYGGDVHGSFQPTPTMVGNMLKGMIIGSRSHFVRETMTDRHHDYGPWMCVPMSVPNRPRSTQQFFEWYFAKGAYTEQGRPMFVGEKALSAWCKVIDACGDVFATAYRDDCLEYIEKQNDKLQRQLEDQSFLDLFLGGFYKLDILNAAYQRDNVPSPKPRLNGVFEGLSMVSPTILEIIKADLIKLTSDPVARSEFPILNMVPNMIARVSRLPPPSTSPTMLGGRGSRSGGQLEIAFPSGGSALQGTELQLGGGLRSAMSPAGQYGPASQRDAAGNRTTAEWSDRTRSAFVALPPGPRKAGVLPESELLTGDEIRAGDVVTLFKTEPMLKGKCTAFYVRDTGCIWDKCNYCTASLRDAASTDPRDLAQALRRSIGSSGARSRPPTPGDRRGRSDSAGSATSVGSQRSDGGGHKPKQRRN